MSKRSWTEKEWIERIIGFKKDEKGCVVYSKSIRVNGKEIGTSRFIYENFKGPIPEGIIVRHTCNNSKCCNLDHLYLTTRGDKSNLNGANRTTPREIVEKIKELRLQNKTIDEICSLLPVSKGTAFKYISGMPLTKEARQTLRRAASTKRKEKTAEKRKLLWEDSHKFKEITTSNCYSKNMKGSIAEAAIIYRLLIHDFSVYSSIFNGHKIDIIASENKTSKLIKIQVKCVKKSSNSITPIVPVRCMEGHSRFTVYENKDLDYIVGYDVPNDLAYVFSWDEIKNIKRCISATLEAKENWKKIE